MKLIVKKTEDFAVDGSGSLPAWNKAIWIPITPVRNATGFMTRAKTLWSDTGIYCLFDCEDQKLTTSNIPDNGDLWMEDVVEVFFWPDDRQPIYFEYEISPMGAQLPLLVANQGAGKFMGWLPWHFRDERLVRRATAIRGGEKLPGASVTGWFAEFFIPFELLKGLNNCPPVPGTQWRANFYRIDYDTGEVLFSWMPGIKNTFHEIEKFGTLVFE